MPAIRTRGRELAELVPDHLREDRRGARPRLDHALGSGCVHLLDAPHEALLDERSLLGATRHCLRPALPALASADDVAGACLLGVTGPPAERDLAPRRDRMTALVLALAAAVRVVDGVHCRAAHRRALAQPARAPGLAARLV